MKLLDKRRDRNDRLIARDTPPAMCLSERGKRKYALRHWRCRKANDGRKDENVVPVIPQMSCPSLPFYSGEHRIILIEPDCAEDRGAFAWLFCLLSLKIDLETLLQPFISIGFIAYLNERYRSHADDPGQSDICVTKECKWGEKEKTRKRKETMTAHTCEKVD